MKVERVYETTYAIYAQRRNSGAGWWFVVTHKHQYGYGRTLAEATRELRHNWTCPQCRRLRVTGHF